MSKKPANTKRPRRARRKDETSAAVMEVITALKESIDGDDAPDQSEEERDAPVEAVVIVADPKPEQTEEVSSLWKPPAKDEIALSEQQKFAKSMIDAWLDSEDQEFRLGGYAGVGKTTLIQYIIETNRSTHSFGVAAFTGKAVSVLHRKGIWRAVTLHSLLYRAEYDNATKKIKWIPRSILPYDVVIVDEASMVSQQLYDDLKRHGVKLLFVGDPAQLEPIGDNPNLMRKCDYTLTEIHRQAQQSPILRLASAIREGRDRNDIPLGTWDRGENGKLTVTKSVYGIDLADYDMIICAKNATRHALNTKRRNQLERYNGPVVGEKVICLQNKRDLGMFNGMILTIDSIQNDSFLAGQRIFTDLSDDIDKYPDIPMALEFFGKDFKRDMSMRTSIPFDYAYALTAHKSQGSEADRVLVFDEPLYNTEWKRWAYTAATRAAKELTYVL